MADSSYWPWPQLFSKLITIPFLRRPMQSLGDPSRYEVVNALNVRVPIASTSSEENDLSSDENSVSLGAWLCFPVDEEDVNFTTWKEAIKSRICNQEIVKVIFYLHGNAETRSQYHRRELYRLLQSNGYLILAPDYRGFGDSSAIPQPNETSMLEDALACIRFLQRTCQFAKSVKFVVYGHSLGSSVTCKLGETLKNTSGLWLKPCGYILAAPFNNMEEEIETFKVANTVARTLLRVDVKKALAEGDCVYDTEKYITSIKPEPILVLHAEDDMIVPLKLGQKLVQVAQNAGCNVNLVIYDKAQGLGHDAHCFAVDFVDTIDEFFTGLKAIRPPSS